MAVISGILKDPIGGLRVGVVIELRAVRTSATVVTLARSQSITDAAGRYTFSVEPGQYDVMITDSGRQPERVGGIQVMVNSATGSLNDFLTIPGETDLNPEIVATVDRMRADAAASAVTAKTNADIAVATVTDTVKKSVTTVQTIAGGFDVNGAITGRSNEIKVMCTENNDEGNNYLPRLRWTDSKNNNRGDIVFGANSRMETWLYTSTGTKNITFTESGDFIPHRMLNFNRQVIGSVDIEAFTPGKSIEAAICRGSDAANHDQTSNLSLLSYYGVGFIPLTENALNTNGAEKGKPSVFINVRSGSVAAKGGFIHAGKSVWSGVNTTVDANGFIKKASPIVKLFGDGSSELNGESQGVTTERVSEGVYRVSGTLGFNSDAEWGGVDGGIEIPTDRNKLPLVWVDYEVDETGDLLIKTFHRVNSTAPKFAQNVKTGYKEGQPIDIPAGRWIDLRVEMPGSDEPEYEPVPEDEKVPEATPKVTEPESGEEQALGETQEAIEEPRE